MNVNILPNGWAGHCDFAEQYPANTAEWLAERRNGVGASEVSTILGFNKYSSPYDLWEEKTGRRAIDTSSPSPQATWGHRMEPHIRCDVAEELGRPVQEIGGVVSLDHPWLRCSPDGVFADDGALLEIKTTSPYLAHEWADGQVADHAELQVQQQLAVTGAPYAIVAVVIDRGPLQLRRVDRDDEVLIPLIVEKTREFWQLVQDDTPPALDGSASITAALIERFPDHFDPPAVDADGVAEQLAADYREADELEKAAKARKNAASNKLRELIGPASGIESPDGRMIAKFKAGRINEAKLREEYPQIYDEYQVAVTKLDTTRMKAEEPDAYTACQHQSIFLPKGN